MKELENLKKKILYRSSYRGTKEMDLLLSKFVIKYIDNLQINDLKDLEIFLDVEDEIMKQRQEKQLVSSFQTFLFLFMVG